MPLSNSLPQPPNQPPPIISPSTQTNNRLGQDNLLPETVSAINEKRAHRAREYEANRNGQPSNYKAILLGTIALILAVKIIVLILLRQH
jgi:hypothetical protein